MDRRNFVKGLVLLGVCPLCAGPGLAAEDEHWSYHGEGGPDHWGALNEENRACSIGSQQSPLDISGATRAELPQLAIDWKTGGTMVNNGHTIQVNMQPGGTLGRGEKVYELLQFHFHAPSEHLADGRSFPMEAHFVHKHAETGDLGVLGAFLSPGATNPAFAALAGAFPAEAGGEVAVADVDPAGMLPASLAYWAYEGSLTTPPCSEIVDWMVAMAPVEVSAADIDRFTALYPMNARPAVALNRRFILSSK